MSTKKPAQNDERQADAPGEGPVSEPTVIKDRRFWGKKAKLADGQEEPMPEAKAEAEHDASPDAQALEAAEAAHRAAVATLQARIDEKDARLNATVAQYKEALEEFEGAKARLKRDVHKDVAKGKRDILEGLLEVLDNLERALQAAKEASTAGSKDFQGFFDGVSMVRDQFNAKLSALGISRVDCMGLPFDPLHFEAISTMPVADAKQHDTVVGVVRDAYLLGGETLRHGIVAVGKWAG